MASRKCRSASHVAASGPRGRAASRAGHSQPLAIIAGGLIEQAIFVATHLVRLWHKADMPIVVRNVRFRG